MRLKIEFDSDNSILLPIQYNHIMQSFIYRSISKKLSEFLHHKGYEINGRRFKLFTFSRIFGEYEINKKKNTISFKPPIRLIVSSALKTFIQEIGEELLTKEKVKIGKNSVSVKSIEVENNLIDDEKVKIKMLSPITIYSTLYKANGKKKTYYYSPFEEEFSELISENARKKYKAFHKKEISGNLRVVGQNVTNIHEKIMSYKGTIIKGWMGNYELSGGKELMKIAYDTGLGGKNSQGFGCFEPLKADGTK